MIKTHPNFGLSCAHLSPKAIQDMGCGMIESSLGKLATYGEMVDKIIQDLETAQSLGMTYNIHLPVYLSEHWLTHHDFYDGFFLAPEASLREMAFDMLKTNLKALSPCFKPGYYVIHFPGVYGLDAVYDQPFEQLLKESLDRLEAIAEAHDCLLALEYFGTNARFSDYRDWLVALQPYKRLKPLLDTGHLYFSCYKNGYDYDEVLRGLAPHCVGFHLWNVQGSGYYGESDSYKAYHHIVPHVSQTREAGWAFEPKTVVPYLAQFNKPMLIEALSLYGGKAYFFEAVQLMLELLRNDEEC